MPVIPSIIVPDACRPQRNPVRLARIAIRQALRPALLQRECDEHSPRVRKLREIGSVGKVELDDTALAATVGRRVCDALCFAQRDQKGRCPSSAQYQDVDSHGRSW